MEQVSQTADSLAALLAWYREMGVDEAVGGTTVDWLAHGSAAPGAGVLEALQPVHALTSTSQPGLPQPSSASRGVFSAGGAPASIPSHPSPSRMPGVTAPPPQRTFPSAPPDVSQLAARTAAGQATSLSELEAALRGFEGCGLKATAKNLCLYRGAEWARVMLIGEAPGRDEDLAGKPFVGPAGQLLDRMLAAIGLGEANVHITNVVYWRPPGNRTPTPQETTVCRPFLERQIGLVEPDVIVPLGGAAAKALLDVSEGIMRVRGRWHDMNLGGRDVRLLATLHPAYLLRTPAAKRLAWRDLLTLKAAL